MRRVSTVIVAALLAAAAAEAQPRDGLTQRGRAVFANNGCYGCHTIDKVGTPIGPDLSHVGARYSAAYLARWLRDPGLQRPAAHMPVLELTDDDVEALARYLSALR
jgi:cbb3-type cytochrome oxidase cytochrome c subunit